MDQQMRRVRSPTLGLWGTLQVRQEKVGGLCGKSSLCRPIGKPGATNVRMRSSLTRILPTKLGKRSRALQVSLFSDRTQ
ncbi:hypothetical protein PAXRUDRAFT_831706 [Paxillus rubicundulus Ve08.2h10]|uniref:Unplaced genomic scaffold scaffold_697, whole genome shotgun sequence n=1 Tax=Paxillus rubicundulus Ve08.2h10 TaxID=930991 RepID=A0A0D0DRM7_9AGAM|nr:hypothetical protein PAXRUDRAFT_831706 [Paxillus rubicundulus Ve08.2h10]